MKILIVDDEPISREILQATCENLGYQVITASDGYKAWEIFNKTPVRLVVSDWVMPGMDGLELCHKIRAKQDSAYTFIFLITGRKTDLSNYCKAMDAGVDDFIYKPVDMDVFRNQLRIAERVLGLIDDHFRSAEKAA